MTYHIRTAEYKCKKCGQVFIAYDQGLKCPNCDTLEESVGESYGFISDLILSMRTHKLQFGTYRPPVWIKTSFTDYIQGIIYTSFDFAEANPDKGIEYVLELFRATDRENKIPNNKHIRRIICQVSLRYNELKNVKESWLKKKLQKLRNYLP